MGCVFLQLIVFLSDYLFIWFGDIRSSLFKSPFLEVPKIKLSFLYYYYNLLTAEVYNIQLPIYGAWFKKYLEIRVGTESRRHYKIVYIIIIGAFSAAAHIFRFLVLRRRNKEKVT